MRKLPKIQSGETYTQWARRILPELTERQHEIVSDMLKEAYLDGCTTTHQLFKMHGYEER